MKLSSIIVVKDEEKNIGKCIDSLLKCADDIIVIVDSKSTDNTLSIVKSYSEVNSEVVEWMGYSGTKNYALKKTKYDWVLWIDGDEVITNELIEELNNLKRTEPIHSAYSVARRAYFLGKWIEHSGWYPGYVIRLFNKNKATFNDNKVHENLEVNGSTGKLKNDLEHFTDPNIAHYYEKFNKYTSLAAQELGLKQKKAGIIDLIIRPVFLFFKMYILRLGFLDGVEGLMLAVFSANYVFTKYSKLWELNKRDN